MRSVIASGKNNVQLSMAKNLNELLGLEGLNFLECAYRTLLKREIDHEGKVHYLSRLNNGRSKIAILDEIMRSPEVKNKNVDCIGLAEAVETYHLKRNKFFARKVNNLQQLFHKKMIRIDPYINNLMSSNISNHFKRSNDIAEKLEGVSTQLSRLNEILQQNFKVELNNNILAKYINENNITNINDHISTNIHHLSEPAEEVVDFSGSLKGHTIVFNLTTSKHWKGHPVGIIRVERELAKYLATLKNTTVKFVVWNSDLKQLKWLTTSEVEQILSDQWVNGELNGLSNEQELLDKARNYQLTNKDAFVSIGLDWDLFPTHDIAALIQHSKAKAILGCYDIIPILFPEYCVRPDFDQMFKTHFVDMAHCASRIWVDSECTKRDLLGFLTNAQVAKDLPPIEFIQLGANTKSDENLPKLSEADASILRHVQFVGDYIIYVSSFESRKNHRLLVNIWRELYTERGENCPQLVIVGMKGWGVDDLLNLMPRMFVQKAGKINFLSNVSDDLLPHLYKHSKFGVFPSLYEGWGLAAAELLSFNKSCIVANNSSLVEATQWLMPSYHPLDFLGWKTEILKLWDDTKYRTQLEKRIKNNFSPRTWTEFSEDFARQMLDLEIRSN